MGTELSQSIDDGKTELTRADNSLEFDRYFRELTALGIWQLSFVSCGLFTAVFAFMFALMINTTNSSLSVIGVGISSWIASVSVWLVLARFRWPVALRIAFALWISVFFAVKPVFEIAFGTDFASVWSLLFSFFTLTTFIFPALATATVALLPYLYREHLDRKNICRK